MNTSEIVTEVKTEIEEITPAAAHIYLAFNENNRTVRERDVESYAADMRSGHWMLTHQGIAFDETGELIDGQHRLLAVIKSGVTVKMPVSRGYASKSSNGIGLFTKDAIDRGRGRNTGDQLQISHGVQEGSKIASICGVLAWVSYRIRNKLTMAQTLEVLHWFDSEIKTVTETLKNFSPGTTPAVLGALAFCVGANTTVAKEFCMRLETGENLQRGNPVYTLRNYLISHWGDKSASRKRINTQCVINAFHKTLLGESMDTPQAHFKGIIALRLVQREKIDKLSTAFGL